jgi:hypothetical protein
MRQFKTICWIAALVVLCVPVSSQAATATLRHLLAEPEFYPGGYTGAADNTIYYYSVTNPLSPIFSEVWMRTSDGMNNQFKANNSASGSYRNLLRFDLSGMSGQGVDVLGNATLTLTISTFEPNAIGIEYSLYQIAAGNAGWQESTNNTGHNPSSPAFGINANNGDPTWFYKSIDATLPVTIAAANDTTSTKWLSGHTTKGGAGSNPEGWVNTGGLWNPWDLVDQDPNTAVPLDGTYYLNMGNMDPVTVAVTPLSGVGAVGSTMTFTIPEAMIQSWIDSPADNAGLLGRSGALNIPSSALGFSSKDVGAAASRPTLTFDYSMPVAVAGDFDGDGDVDGNDLTDPALGWNARYGTDLDGADFLVWQQNYGTGVALVGASAVPEPTALALVLVLSSCLITTRR